RRGLRGVVNPDFASMYGAGLQDQEELLKLLTENAIFDGIASLSRHLSRRLHTIPTDFTLNARDRKLLDLVAYLLVHGKLAADVAQWNEVARAAASAQDPVVTCLP